MVPADKAARVAASRHRSVTPRLVHAIAVGWDMTSSRPTVDAAAGVTWSGRPSASTRTWSSRAAVREAISATAASSPACAHPASRRNAAATPGRSHSDKAAGSVPERHAASAGPGGS